MPVLRHEVRLQGRRTEGALGAAVSRLLVVAPNWIGDALMAQPLLARLRERMPDLRLDVLAPGWVAPVFARMPEVSEVLSAPLRHGALQLRERWWLGRALKARGYREAIVLPNSWKSALMPFFAGIPVRSGYLGESRYGLLNRIHRRPENAHEREPMTLHYARLSAPPGTVLDAFLPEPRLRADPATARTTAARFGFAPRSNAVLCPGAEYGPAKRWPAERYGALAAALGARGFRTWLLGSAADAAVCEEVLHAAGAAARGAVVSLAGRTTLDEAIDLIASADLVVSNDSGLMHVAAALGVPQVALFGSSSPAHTPPLSTQARVIWLGIECSPCFARVCPLGHFRCMREITLERALEEIERLGPQSDAGRAAP